MKKYILAAAAALLALAACNREQIAEEKGSLDVRFTSNIENTFAVKGLDPLAAGKTVRILAGTPISASTDAEAVSGGTLTPATPLKWKENQSAKTTFVGIYPSKGETEPSISNYSLIGEGGVQDFEYQNNFLTALAKDVTPGATVNLEFKHPFVKMVMNIDNQLTGTPEVSAVEVSEVVLAANLILDAGTIVPAADKGSVKATKNATSGKFEAIIMPQDGAKPVLALTVGTTLYTFRINAATNFVAGKTYTASLTLKDTTPVVVDGDPVSFGFTVTDWEEEATPLVATDVTDVWSVVGDVAGGWGNDIVMVEGATPGVLEANITYRSNNEFKLRKAFSWTVSAGLKEGVAYVGATNWDGHLDATDNNIKLAAEGEYKITFNPEGWIFTATKTGDVEPDPSATTGKLIFNVYNGPAWDTMTMYGWVEADPWPNYTGAWPGAAPQATDVVVNAVTYKSFVIDNVPLNADNLFYLLYGGDDAKKTINLKLPVVLTAAETTVFVQLKNDLSVEVISDPSTFTPPAAPTGDTWAVMGLAGVWTGSGAIMTQDETDPNLYTVEVTLGNGTDNGGIKFRANGSWDKQFGATEATSGYEGFVVDLSSSTEANLTLAANDNTSKNIIITPDKNRYKLSLYVDGTNKGKLTITKL